MISPYLRKPKETIPPRLIDVKRALIERDLLVEDLIVYEGYKVAISSGCEAIFNNVKINENAKVYVKGTLCCLGELTIEDGGELIVYDGAEVEIYGS